MYGHAHRGARDAVQSLELFDRGNALSDGPLSRRDLVAKQPGQLQVQLVARLGGGGRSSHRRGFAGQCSK
ncbi:hypothetical protein SDC9_196886 [bioreactor metagenome]|uniref:Uncharacterized protein n=1 Tax=bioreactor metagenome TaxID=1076179 RepID=A0A645IFL7_9ZZZZ